MFKNYFKTTFRNLRKNKTYSFLNIFGLAIGIACTALIFLWVEDELTYNHYFTNRNNLYKVKDRQTYDGTTFTFDATPGPLAQGMKTEIPGIKNTARSTDNTLLFSLGDKSIYEHGNYVDSNLFSMLQLSFIKGQAANAFTQLHSIVITEKMAEKFFGTTDVVGKTLKVNNQHDYVVTGVIQNLPENVSFNFDWLASFEIFEKENSWLQFWGSNGVTTYVEVQPNADINAINKQLFNYISRKTGGDAVAKISIYPMNRWRLYDSFDNGKEKEGRIKYVNLFSTIAWIILIIACINFMNLATARSEKRAREVGVRKVLGAGKRMLITQFISEALTMSFISALLATGIIGLALPGFNRLVEKELSLNLFQPLHLSGLFTIALICGLIAGSYPAFYLSSFSPVTVLKGLKIKTNASAGFIRKGLVIVQFSISIILIIGTVVVYQQINHIKNRRLGYDKEGLVYMNLQGKMKDHFNAIKNDLLATGTVQNASLSNNQVLQLGSNTGGFSWQGKDPNKDILITYEGVSPEYVSTMGMKLKAGRDFYQNTASDSNNIIINESLAKLLKTKDPVGSLLTSDEGRQKHTVVGVIDDFVYNNMYSSTATPLILFSDTSNVNFLNIRFKAKTDLTSALAKAEKVIKVYNPGYPFEYQFVDEQFGRLFKTETLIGQLSSVFSTLAILISCLGLFGLAAYTAERRTKEMGIRKVLGATTTALASLLSKDFLQLVVISCLFAFPVAWWAMNNWLQAYAYRIEISWWIFLIAGLLAIVIALLTVSFQAIKAAIANPVKSLRTE